MINCSKKKLLLPLISLLFHGCSVNNGISLIYLFDTSGSFHRTALPNSVELAEKLFYEISSEKDGIPVFPQIHQVGTIDEQSVAIGFNCNIRIDQKNIFEKNRENPDLSECLGEIKASKRSIYTDLEGALLTASESLQTSGLYGKGIIIFSDLHEDVLNPKSYNYDLSGVSVFVVYERSKEQIRTPGLFEEDKNSLQTRLINHGVKKNDIMFRNLKSLNTSPNEIVTFFRKSFRDNK